MLTFPPPTLTLNHTVPCTCGGAHDEQVRVYFWGWPEHDRTMARTTGLSEHFFRTTQPYAAAWWVRYPLGFLILGMQ